MTIYSRLKKEIASQISRFVPIRVKKGISKEMKLFGKPFYNRRRSELSLEEKLYRALKLKNKTIIEAGSHIGIFTFFFSRRKNAHSILSFEPNPNTFWLLKKNMTVNQCSNVLAINMGVSNVSGKLHYVSKRFCTETGTFKANKQFLLKESKSPFIEKIIPVISIDEAANKYQLRHVDFVKIDTEGFEPFVIEGMKNTCKKHEPLVYFEIHGLTDEEKFNDLMKIYDYFKQNCDFKIYKLTPEITEINDGNVRTLYTGSFLAFKSMDCLERMIDFNQFSTMI